MYDRRYWRDIGLWTVVYVGLVLLTVHVVERLPAGSAWRYAAVVPVWVVAVAGMLIELSLLRRIDELQRRIYQEASLAALWLTVVTIITVWLLEAFAGLPRVAPVWMLIATAAGFVFGYVDALRRYR